MFPPDCPVVLSSDTKGHLRLWLLALATATDHGYWLPATGWCGLFSEPAIVIAEAVDLVTALRLMKWQPLQTLHELIVVYISFP